MGDVLILNADAQPISFLPLSAVQWKEAITYMWLDKCTVLDWYDDWVVRSASWETKVPSVIILKEMMRRRRNPRFSKANLYIRDEYTCQYCNTPYSKSNLTLDHVTPLSLGGKTNWENIVAACGPCNSRKGNRMHMKPICDPWRPDYYELVAKRKKLGFEVRHKSWLAYLG
tara:strand:+ start:3009 stop:3521 length:513 start_codon:yes stop_codon:yes gene_type:complete